MESDLEPLLGWKVAAVAAWFVLLFAAERLRPAAAEPAETGLAQGPAQAWGRWRRVARNLSLWLLNLPLSLLVVVPLTAWASGIAPVWRPVWWSGWTGLALDLVLLDFLIYWWHRANHRWQPLWRFHAVHHLDRFLDSTSALRFHFGEVLLSALARAAVILALGFPLASVLVFETLLLVATIFHHSNLRLPAGLERALSWVVVTPSIHWLHHHRKRSDTDSNYATILSLWDRLFGSRNPGRRRPEMAIGVEGEEEETALRLLVRPFR
jgi:sterol desaturase/sphingolipid hydroxylase (fatty acid hydroxylase superfamily)